MSQFYQETYQEPTTIAIILQPEILSNSNTAKNVNACERQETAPCFQGVQAREAISRNEVKPYKTYVHTSNFLHSREENRCTSA